MEVKKKLTPKFSDVFEEYKEIRFSDLEFASIEVKTSRLQVFYAELKDVHMEDITAEFFKKLIIIKKKEYANSKKRLSFDLEIKEYKAIFNWYRDFKDYKFIVPLTKFHKQLGRMRKAIPKNRRMSVQQVQKFFNAFESNFFRDFAITQFFSCARVSEIAGLQTRSIDLTEGVLLIKDVVVWNKSKLFVELKPYTKNNDVKYVRIIKPLYDIFVRRLSDGDPHPYVFHIEGEPLKYRQIQHHYDKAFKRAGLDFSGTHTLRHSMASIARELSGSIDAIQSLTGHKSVCQAEHYAGLSQSSQLTALNAVAEVLKVE